MKSSQAAASRRPGVPPVGEVIAGKYRVEGIVGAGGMGVVVSARHVQLGQVVAIKLLTAPADEDVRDDAITRFLHEAQAAAKLQSDHVVRIYDVGRLPNGLPFMVMELLQGVDLSSLLDQRGALPEAQAIDFVLQACAGVAEAHRMGLVHRDLKPSNLFVTQRSDGLPLLKVLDFGISKQIADPISGEPVPSLTNTRTLIGSPNYMSPEQIRDSRRVDARTDVWALGIILQELLTNAPVFHGESFPGVCAAIVADAPMPVRTLRPDISRALEAVIERCLKKDPLERFPNVAALVAALAELAPRMSVSGSDPLPLIYDSATRVNLGTASASQAAAATEAVNDAATVVLPGGERTLESERMLTSDSTFTALSSPDSRIEVLAAESKPKRSHKQRARALVLGAVGVLLFGAFLVLVRRPAPSSAPTRASAGPTGALATSPLAPPTAPISQPPPAAAAVLLAPPAPQATAAGVSAPAPSAQKKPRSTPRTTKPAPPPASDIRLER